MKKSKFNYYLLFLLSFSYIFSQNVAPTLIATGNQYYCPLSSINIVTDMQFIDPDDIGVDNIYIQITSGFSLGNDTLTLTGSHPNVQSSWNSTTGKLTLSGISGQPTYTELEAAIEDIVFTSTQPNLTGSKSFSITVGQANYLPSNGHYYLYVSNLGISWSTAQALAASSSYYGLQGYLATITSSEEAQLVGAQASGAGWIGGSDQETEGVWKWVTGPEAGTIFWNGLANGTTPNFAFWNTSEPNNFDNRNEDYAHVTAPGVGITGSWNDLTNTGEANGNYQPKGYVIEYGGMPGDPLLNIATSTTITVARIETTSSDTICGNGSLTLGATANTSTVYWYDTTTSTAVLDTANNYTTPVLTNTTTYYAAPMLGCTTNRIAVDANIISIPTVTVNTPNYVCDSVTHTINAATTAGVLNWYSSATSTTAIYVGTNFVVPDTSSDSSYFIQANNSGCTSAISQIDVFVYPETTYPDIDHPICSNETLTLDAPLSSSTYLWNTGATTQSITHTNLTNYSVEIRDANNCVATQNFMINESESPEIDKILINQLEVTIEVLSGGTYEFSVDGINYQSSNQFTMPQSGQYTAYVRDFVNNCGYDIKEFVLIAFPPFFTPNGDGFNDVWGMNDIGLYPTAKINIFDRFGKLITQLNPVNTSWDGTLKGKLLPSSDYWFVAKLGTDFPDYAGHFSLKR
jgi:gliding motility-associated-like protein